MFNDTAAVCAGLELVLACEPASPVRGYTRARDHILCMRAATPPTAIRMTLALALPPNLTLALAPPAAAGDDTDDVDDEVAICNLVLCLPLPPPGIRLDRFTHTRAYC